MMRGCHHVKVKDLGRVLIPGCIAVSVSNDIEDCTCYVHNKKRYTADEMVIILRREIKGLKKELKESNLLRVSE